MKSYTKNNSTLKSTLKILYVVKQLKGDIYALLLRRYYYEGITHFSPPVFPCMILHIY